MLCWMDVLHLLGLMTPFSLDMYLLAANCYHFDYLIIDLSPFLTSCLFLSFSGVGEQVRRSRVAEQVKYIHLRLSHEKTITCYCKNISE